MNNAVNMAISRIKQQIPHQILQLAFYRDMNTNGILGSLEQALTDKIITGIVRPDCNLLGGRPVALALKSSYHEPSSTTTSYIHAGNGHYSIYRIPAEERLHSPIVEVHNVQYPMPYGNGENYTAGGGGRICDYAKEMVYAHTGGGKASTPIVELLQGDLIRLHPGGFSHIDWVIHCRVAYDENMTNLNNPAIDSFARLCVLATKRHCYNTLIIELDRGYIDGGMEISTIKQLVENWSNLDEEYNELLRRHFAANKLDVTSAAVLFKYML